MNRHLLFLLWTLLLVSRASAKKSIPTSIGVVDARLVNGPSHCSGHLEMKHKDQWRTLTIESSLSFTVVGFAELACRQMDCGSVASLKVHINTTEPKPAWEMHFSCLISDVTIQECIKKARRNKVEDVESVVTSTYVECSESLRVTDWAPISYCSGKVTAKSGQNWLHVCETETPQNKELMGKMMCAELGCGPPRSVQYVSAETAVESRIIQCHGNETRLEQCPASAHGYCKKVLHIDCEDSFAMRLVGQSRCRGALLGKRALEWRPMKMGPFRFEEEGLNYLCRILDCGSIISATSLHFDHDEPLWEMVPACGEGICKAWESAYGRSGLNVACTESVGLVNSYNRCIGKVEVKHGHGWHKLCHDSFTLKHAFVSCRDLGCGFPREFVNSWKVRKALRLNCSGHEEHLKDCPLSSLPALGADDECEATFLVCKSTPPPPVVTMFSRMADVRSKELVAYDGHRVLVTCSTDSSELTRARSFLLTFSAHGATELKGNQSAVDNVAQFVFEAELNQTGSYSCSYDYVFSPNVFSEEATFDLKVQEPMYARLSGGGSRCLGSLELEHEGEWRPVSHQQWGRREATVVCRQLHCGSAIYDHYNSKQSGKMQPVWKFYSDCDGSERALLGCGSVRKWMSSTTVHVLCSDILAPPSITVLAHRLYTENTEHAVVYTRHDFLVNCSVEARFPGGQFFLTSSTSSDSGNNEDDIDHWEVYTVYRVGKEHSGNYMCVYRNTIARHDFTFQSKPITITVKEAGDIMLDDGLQLNDSSKSCSGTLLMRNTASQMKMVTVGTSAWNMRHASIVCKQLDCGRAVSTSKIQLQTLKPMWRYFSDCEGSEDALLDCGHIEDWVSSTAVQVACAGE